MCLRLLFYKLTKVKTLKQLKSMLLLRMENLKGFFQPQTSLFRECHKELIITCKALKDSRVMTACSEPDLFFSPKENTTVCSLTPSFQ